MGVNKRVLCIGDSLALPGHRNKYEDTWYYKLKMAFSDFDFIAFFRRQLTTDSLVTMGGGENGVDGWPKGADCLEAYRPDIVIVQLGIVDCAPRLLNKFDRIVAGLLPEQITKHYINLLRSIRVRNPNNTIVPFKRFKDNWENYGERAHRNGVKLIIISISIPDTSVTLKSPYIQFKVKEYNDLLLSVSRKYPNVCVTEPLNPMHYDQPIYEDGYHPNNFGQSIIFSQVKSWLK